MTNFPFLLAAASSFHRIQVAKTGSSQNGTERWLSCHPTTQTMENGEVGRKGEKGTRLAEYWSAAATFEPAVTASSTHKQSEFRYQLRSPSITMKFSLRNLIQKFVCLRHFLFQLYQFFKQQIVGVTEAVMGEGRKGFSFSNSVQVEAETRERWRGADKRSIRPHAKPCVTVTDKTRATHAKERTRQRAESLMWPIQIGIRNFPFGLSNLRTGRPNENRITQILFRNKSEKIGLLAL